MKERNFEMIKRKLQVFGLGKLQDLITLLGILEREDIALGEVKEFVEFTLGAERNYRITYEKKMKEMQAIWDRGTRKCPTCGAPLILSPVREPKGKANVKGYTCLWYCPREECKFEEYSRESYKELYMKIMSRR